MVRPLPYYGTLRVEVERAGHRPEGRMVTADAPVTPWLFPLDLPLELVLRVFGRNDVRVAIPLTPESAPTTEPPTPETLRAHAAALGVRR